ncbi:MAG: sugar transferase [Candidatus Omnitrophica bacterium]|nr:sugar transferase [Candidatus Omnitrophota bacterium]
MFRERVKFFIRLDMALDIALIVISFIVAIISRELSMYHYLGIEQLVLTFNQYSWVLLIACPFIMVSLYASGAYGPLRFKPAYLTGWIIIRSFLITVLSLIFIFFIFKIYLVSRLFLAAFGIIGSILLASKKFLEIALLKFFRQKKLNVKYIVLVGRREDFEDIIKKITQVPEYGLEIVGLVSLENNTQESENQQAGLELYHGLNGLGKILKEKVVDYILFTGYKNNEKYMEQGLLLCEEHGVEVWLAADFFHMKIAHQDIDTFFDMPVIIFRSSPKFGLKLIIKRLIDIVISSALLILSIPLLLFITAAIKLETRGPAIFTQKRTGLNGRIFTLYKFRSMVSQAEQHKQELERFNEMSGPVFKITKDPRVTKIGLVLRRMSLDELPQMYNILKGDMSLVGPRPLPDYEADKLAGWQRRRLRMRPGLTCIWQIKGRSSVDFYKWMEYDLEYVDHWTLGLDFYILFKTFFVVFSGKGAC